MSEEIYLDSEHRIVVHHEIKGNLDVETIKVERCWYYKYNNDGSLTKKKDIEWFEDHASYVNLIQAAWWGSKWHHEKS